MPIPVSSRTFGGGEPRRCGVCRQRSWVEPSWPAGDAPCPACGHLLWPGDRAVVSARPVGAARRAGLRVRPLVQAVAGSARRLAGRVRATVGKARAAVGSAAVARTPRRPPSPAAGVWDPWLDA